MARSPTTARRLPGPSADAHPEEPSEAHGARKALFARALARGYVSREELDAALPSGALTDSERWLLHYSLRAANIEVRDGAPQPARKRSDRAPAASKPRRRT